VAVAKELKSAALWNPQHGDALATFLLSIAVNLRESGALLLIEHAIEKAAEYAGSLQLRLTARLMLVVIQLARKGVISYSFSMRLVCRLWQKLLSIPKHKGYWKTITPMSSEIPSALLQILRRHRFTPMALCNDLQRS
jgi:hypothetical protein